MPQQHPVDAWLEANGKSYEDLATLVRARGGRATADYLKNKFKYCYHEPGRRLEEHVSEICGIDRLEIRGYPYQTRRAA